MNEIQKQRFVLNLKLKTELYQEDILNKRFEIGRQIYNSCLGELYKRYNLMRDSKQYKKILKMQKDKDRNKLFSELNKKYNLTEYSLHNFVIPMLKHYNGNIDSYTIQKIASRCFDAFKRLMIHKCDNVYFKKYNSMGSLEGKSNSSGIRFKDNKLMWKGLDISVIVKPNDVYAQMALENKIKYCRITRKFIRGKYKYHVQLILEGTPPIKFNKENGEVKTKLGTGNVGIDIGTQTIAYSSKSEVKLLELCPEVNCIYKEKNILQRKLDRQRRSNNPNNYNKDGTIKRGIKLNWIKSKKYIKTQNKLREIQRKQASIRKQSHEKLANYIIGLGDRVLVETMNFNGLQKRAKETTINQKTGKFNRKKRFGKSLANKAPAKFLSILDNKLKWFGKELLKIKTTSVKASQYNHFEDKYIKKELKDRWNLFDNYKIQRDLYSAFLIMNVDDSLDTINRELCFYEFENFLNHHNNEILRLKNCEYKKISSMGI